MLFDLRRDIICSVARFWLRAHTLQIETVTWMLHQIYAVPDLCCIVGQRLVELVGGVFDRSKRSKRYLLLSSAVAVFEHVKDELEVTSCLLLATL